MRAGIRAAAAGMAALVLAGCPAPGPERAELPVRLRVQPADTLSPGDSLRMTAYLRNPGRTDVQVEFDSQCQVVFYVHAPDKLVLHPPGGGTTCVRAPSTVTVPAGDSIRFADAWLATSSTTGPHTAYAVLWEHHVVDEAERHFKPGHRSNIVQFEVAQP